MREQMPSSASPDGTLDDTGYSGRRLDGAIGDFPLGFILWMRTDGEGDFCGAEADEIGRGFPAQTGVGAVEAVGCVGERGAGGRGFED